MEEKKERDVNYALGGILSDFISESESLYKSLPFIMTAAETKRDFLINEHKKYLEQVGELIEQKEGRKRYRLPISTQQKAKSLRKEIKIAETAVRILPRSFIVSLISSYDSFLSKLLITLLKHKIEFLNSSEKSLTFTDLSQFASIDEAKESILSKEIESVLRENHTDHLKWIENKFKIKISPEPNLLKTFIELTERRNLFVHNSGIASKHYIKTCQDNGVPLPENVEEKQLEVDAKYFKTAYCCVIELGIKLCHVLWRKLIPEGMGIADIQLNDIILQLLIEEDYEMACVVLDFALNILKKHHSEEYKKIFLVNQVIAFKFMGNTEKALNLLDSEDWSACSNKFQLANAILKDEFETASKIMRKIGTEEPYIEDAYHNWPLFKEMRKSEHFLKAYEDVFKKPFALVDSNPSRN